METFVPLLPPKWKLIHKLFVFLWFITLIAFWVWWLQISHFSTFWGIIINSFVLIYTTILPAWFYLSTLRMTRVNPKLPIPKLRVAIITTKVPSEDFSILEKTLKGMLNQKFPYKYDVWLADEQPSKETKQWCKKNKVKISTRFGVKEYHKENWPRRTRTKEGNLAYFYDHYGYKKYDVVAQLDADHVPNSDYLEHMVRPFANPKIGYVAAPSICDANISNSWSARGRLCIEAPTHGPMQASFNNGFAPLCIGSHYAVRTQALKEVGGLGPELAEDHSTTLWINSGGWDGAFAIDAEAHGDGPETFIDFLVQEYQWSRSIITILVRYGREKIPSLTFRKKFQLIFSEVWYILVASSMIVGYLIPFLALITKKPLVNVDYIEFIFMMFLLTLTSMLPSLVIQKFKLMRPKESPLVTIDSMMYLLSRWPWVVKGVISGFYAGITGKEVPFKVTDKGKQKASFEDIPVKIIRPYIFLSILSALLAILIRDPGAAFGYYYIAMINAIIYFCVALYIVLMHSREQVKMMLISPQQFLALSVTLSFVIIASYLRGNIFWLLLGS